jgi:hypothetical protein
MPAWLLLKATFPRDIAERRGKSAGQSTGGREERGEDRRAARSGK